MASNSTRPRARRKPNATRPEKPYTGFPLTAHPLGYWCKSIRGKIHYFGRWGNKVNGRIEILPNGGEWNEALNLFEKQRDALYAGRKPRDVEGELNVGALCNRFLDAKLNLRNSGELTPRTFKWYNAVTDRIVSAFGEKRVVEDLGPEDFGKLRAEMAKKLGPVALASQIQGVRCVLKFAWDERLIKQPVNYGQQFKKPSKKTLRQNRSLNGERMFEPNQIQKLIKAAQPQMKAMILLGINCGFGNTDCSSLPVSAIDLERCWVDFPRPKTGVGRRCPLWPETVKALQAVLKNRPAPKNAADDDLVFITIFGQPWVKTKSGSSDDAITKEMAKLLKELKLHRPGLGFYALRHTFQTIGEDAGETATRYIMGHVDDSMSAQYRERISDDRLKVVTDHVRDWLFRSKSNRVKPRKKAM